MRYVPTERVRAVGRGTHARPAGTTVAFQRARATAGRFFEIPTSDEGAELVRAAPVVKVRGIVRRFWPYVRARRRGLLALLVLTGVSPLIGLAEIWLFKVLVDDLLVPRDFGQFPRIAALYGLIEVASAVLRFSNGVLSTSTSQRFIIDLRADVFRHVQALPVDTVEGRRRGDVVSRLTSDIGAIESFLLGGITSLVSYGVRLAVYTVALFVLDWRLALVALTVAPAFGLVAQRSSRRMKLASREKRRRSGSISVVVEEALRNAALVHAYNGEEREDARLARASEAKYQAEIASARLRGVYSPVISAIETLGALIVIGYGAYGLSHGRLSVGELLGFLALLTGLYSPIRGLSGLATSGWSAAASAERVIELLDTRPAVTDPPSPVPVPDGPLSVEFDQVTFTYPGAGTPALQDVGFRAEPGTVVALVGASGAGKSSAAKLLLRMHDATAGSVRIGGVDVRELGLADLRQHVAVVLQETLVFDGTVRDNIAYGRPGATDEEVEAAARAADAHEFILALPEGYDTRVGEHGGRLSGGQRQRLAIARALIKDAPVVLLDEPTTGLDAASTGRVLAATRRLMAGRTTIVISHDLHLSRDADEILVLDGGRLVERGDHVTLLAAGGAYARLCAAAWSSSHGQDRAAARRGRVAVRR